VSTANSTTHLFAISPFGRRKPNIQTHGPVELRSDKTSPEPYLYSSFNQPSTIPLTVVERVKHSRPMSQPADPPSYQPVVSAFFRAFADPDRPDHLVTLNGTEQLQVFQLDPLSSINAEEAKASDSSIEDSSLALKVVPLDSWDLYLPYKQHSLCSQEPIGVVDPFLELCLSNHLEKSNADAKENGQATKLPYPVPVVAPSNASGSKRSPNSSSSGKGTGQHNQPDNSSAERSTWMSHVELVTHQDSTVPLWASPQFTLCTSSSSSPSSSSSSDSKQSKQKASNKSKASGQEASSESEDPHAWLDEVCGVQSIGLPLEYDKFASWDSIDVFESHLEGAAEASITRLLAEATDAPANTSSSSSSSAAATVPVEDISKVAPSPVMLASFADSPMLHANSPSGISLVGGGATAAALLGVNENYQHFTLDPSPLLTPNSSPSPETSASEVPEISEAMVAQGKPQAGSTFSLQSIGSTSNSMPTAISVLQKGSSSSSDPSSDPLASNLADSIGSTFSTLSHNSSGSNSSSSHGSNSSGSSFSHSPPLHKGTPSILSSSRKRGEGNQGRIGVLGLLQQGPPALEQQQLASAGRVATHGSSSSVGSSSAGADADAEANGSANSVITTPSAGNLIAVDTNQFFDEWLSEPQGQVGENVDQSEAKQTEVKQVKQGSEGDSGQLPGTSAENSGSCSGPSSHAPESNGNPNNSSNPGNSNILNNPKATSPTSSSLESNSSVSSSGNSNSGDARSSNGPNSAPPSKNKKKKKKKK